MCRACAAALNRLAAPRPQVPSALFFQYNTQLGPPFHIIIDTNFINFAIKNKLDVVRSMMDCLLAKCACRACAGGLWRALACASSWQA